MLAKKLEAPPDDWRAQLPRYIAENLAKNNEIVEKIAVMAEKYKCSAAQLSLAWLFHKAESVGVSVIPIPGSTTLKNVRDNLGAVKIQISDDDCKLLEEMSQQVACERGSEWYMSLSIESQK